MNPSFYIVRHGTTAANNPKAELIRGWQPLPISPKGEREAKQAGYWLCGRGVTTLWHSPLKRVKQTTDLINDSLKLDKAHTKSSGLLLDWNTGAMENMLVEAMKPLLEFFQLHPKLIVPHGESYGEYWDRWNAAFKETCLWVEKNPAEKLVVVTHARNIVTLQHVAKGHSIGPVSYDNVPNPGGIMEVTVLPDSFKIKQVYGTRKQDKDP